MLRDFVSLLLFAPVTLVMLSPVPSFAQEELYRIAEAVASPTFPSWEAARDGFQDNVVMLRQELAWQVLALSSSANSDLESYRQARLSDYGALRQSMERIRALDQRVPDYASLATDTLKASPGLYKAAEAAYNDTDAALTDYDKRSLEDLAANAVSQLIEAGVNAWEASEERTQYRSLYRSARRNAVDLENVVRASSTAPPRQVYGMGCLFEFSEDGETVSVQSTLSGSPAESAGLTYGDIVQTVNGVTLNREQFSTLLGPSSTPSTEPVKLSVLRAGVQYEFEVQRTMPIVQSVFGADLDSSLNSYFTSDMLYVSNLSGTDLTNVFLFTSLKGTVGDWGAEASDRHMHFVRSWKAGETKVICYQSRAVESIASDESVDRIQSIEFRLYSDQYSQTETYEHTQEAYDADILAYFENKSFTAQWWDYPDGHLLYYSGVTLATGDGLPFPASSVTITAYGLFTSVTESFSFSGGTFDGEEYLSSEQFNNLGANKLKAEFSFPGSSQVIEVEFDL